VKPIYTKYWIKFKLTNLAIKTKLGKTKPGKMPLSKEENVYMTQCDAQ
jgi:hypothetical protein